MTHDPMTAITGDDIHALSPWESLAQQARRLADLADRYAAAAPEGLAPADDLDDPHDILADLDARALAIRSVVSACRRATWQRLRDQGQTFAEIGRQWGCSGANVRQVLLAQDRPR